MTDAETVERELARLARGEPVPDWERERVVRRAEAAIEDVATAADFADGGGVARLEWAVAAADRAGDDGLARRGREALRAFEAFRRACDPGGGLPAADRRDAHGSAGRE